MPLVCLSTLDFRGECVKCRSEFYAAANDLTKTHLPGFAFDGEKYTSECPVCTAKGQTTEIEFFQRKLLD